MATKISWTDESWNPIIGCSKVSDGCTHCYAERMACRLGAMGVRGYNDGVLTAKGHWTGKTALVESALEKPLHWKKPRMIFVCSMGDLFHESVPFEWDDEVFAVIALCPQHTFQVLTKRADRMREYFATDSGYGRWGHIEHRARKIANIPKGKTLAGLGESNLPNVWIGATAENQEMADQRIPILLDIPAAVRFVSCEPLLEEIEISDYFDPVLCADCGHIGTDDDFDILGADDGNGFCNQCNNEVPFNRLDGIDWVIVGAESGAGRRECEPEWIGSIVDQCKAVDVPVFVKQVHGDNKKIIKNPSCFPQQWPKTKP